MGPVLIALLDGVALGEGFLRALFAGCAVAFAGAVVIWLATSGQGLEASWAAALCLSAATAYAGVVSQKPSLPRPRWGHFAHLYDRPRLPVPYYARAQDQKPPLPDPSRPRSTLVHLVA